MTRQKLLCSILLGSAAALFATAAVASAEPHDFNIPGGDLQAALEAYTKQSGVQIIFPVDQVRRAHTGGVHGFMESEIALAQILRGTDFIEQHDPSGAISVVSGGVMQHSVESVPVRLAAAASSTGIESVVVTSSKIKGDIQTVPIAITALSQEQLTSRQIAGGPDLVKEVPNLTFSKTNFSGYNIQIRGIGTQAISVTTDPAVAVAFNDIPFIRNHFFEQEFYDVSQVEVVRGPQGTLYGRNATAGVVNVVSAKPTDQYEAMASVDVGNYNNRRFEGMVNIPIVGDQLDLRVAGEWTKRDGYTFNEQTDQSVDGRDLWSGRVSVLFHPIEKLTATAVWEHFSEDDDRLRSGKQLCDRDPGPSVVDGPAGPQIPDQATNFGGFLTQGCLPGSLYAPSAYGAPNANSNPFIDGLEYFANSFILPNVDPYAGVSQSHNLRTIDSLLNPKYRAKNDTLEFNANYDVTPSLTLTSQTGYNKDMLYSTEDYDRFNSSPGLFVDPPGAGGLIGQDGQFCDPQLGCSTRLVGEDVSQEHAWQFSQEVRLASNFSGPLNFSVGANYLHYQTVEDYYVFYNAITLLDEYINSNEYPGLPLGTDVPHAAFNAAFANSCDPIPADPTNIDSDTLFGLGCAYIDPNPLGRIDGQGHNYFRSENPYRLNSWAGFGEAYYQLTPDLKLTGGLRWTEDRKSFTDIPSWAAMAFEGLPVAGIIDQTWREWTGRFNASWTPKLDFTDQSMFYASYARGYKGGGANPPGVTPVCQFGLCFASPSDTTHPLTFAPEFVNAYELGTKNTLLDGAVTLNGDIFYYDYKNYQISQIVDRTSVNLNFNASVKGAEIESTWEPLPGLRFDFAGGYENATLASGSQAIDLMDRTAGHSGWMVLKPFITETSNCVLPTYVVNELLSANSDNLLLTACQYAYTNGIDPVTIAPYQPISPNFPGYPGYDPCAGNLSCSVHDIRTGTYVINDPDTGQNTYNGVDYVPPNNGDGFAKNLSGNQLPNAPHFTVSLGAQYTMPVSEDWAATLRGDFYWQSQSFARVFNDRPYDKLRGYSTTNLTLIFTNSDGWEAMAYMKNVFNTTAITGAFLNSDDSGLTTNIFTTDPRLYGLRLTKNF